MDNRFLLSAEQFDQILGGISGATDNFRNGKRAFPRAGVRASARIIPVVDGKAGDPMTVRIRDLSRQGIGLVHSDKLRTGTCFIINLGEDEDGKEIALVCTVRNCRRVSEGLFGIGASFAKHLITPKPRPVQKPAAERSALNASMKAPPRPEIKPEPELERIQRAILS